MITRRRFLKAAGAAFGAAGATIFYTWRIEPHWLEIVERPLPVAGLPPDLAGLRVAQLSDLHIGQSVSDAYLLRSFQRLKELAPEFVVYTGDFISYGPGIFAHAGRIFPHLPMGRRGTFGILGNHDYGRRWSQDDVAASITTLAKDSGVRVLRNEAAEVDGLYVLGLDDLWAGRFDLAAGLKAFPYEAAAIVLSHNPDTADLPGWNSYSGWILSGHTHGGQCKPPFLPPPLLPVRNLRYTCGEFVLSGGRHLYISRGVGHLQRVRFNVRPEITLFRLERA
jgi:uncharacterized protein